MRFRIGAGLGLLVLIVSQSAVQVNAQQNASAPAAASKAADAAPSGSNAPAAVSAGAADPAIPVGTRITTQNWSQYAQYMSDGVAAFFQGSYFWKMPPQAGIDVGPTIINPLPKTYVDATAKYADQVSLTELPDGGLNIANYHGGVPFPNPQEPHRAWKVLADVWYRYTPNITVAGRSAGCTLDKEGNVRCTIGTVVYRQLGYNTDPGVPQTVAGAEGKYSSLWFMIDEPEEQRYTASLTIAYADPSRSEDLYAFIPALRRYQPVSTAARCSTTEGVDITQEDYRGGFDSNITQFKAEFLGEKKILALILPGKMPAGRFPNDYEMPMGWPSESWGKWQVRDAYVISISKLPAYASGYCYGKRVMYVTSTRRRRCRCGKSSTTRT